MRPYQKVIVLPLLLLLQHMGIAQINYTWAQKISGIGVESISKMQIDAAGNVYVIGSFDNTTDFDPGPGTATLTPVGSDDVFFARYDASGNYVWAKSIGTPSSDLGYDLKLAGNFVYICGTFAYGNQSADFDPGPGVAMLTSIGNIDAFFGKYDQNGNYIWAENVASQNNDHAPCISVDGSGNVFVGVECSTVGVDFDPGPGVASIPIIPPWNFVVAKYDMNGAYLWAKPFAENGAWHWMTDLANDAAGNVYAAGYFSGTTDFDPGPGVANMTPIGGFDACMFKLDANGNYMWAKQAGGPQDDFGEGLVLNTAGTVIYWTGYYKSTCNFNVGGAASNLTSAGGFDGFFSKFDPNGNFTWAKSIGGTIDDQPTDIRLDNCENVYITGGFNSPTIDLDPSPGVISYTSAGGYDAFFSKYTSNGCYLASLAVGGPGDDISSSMTVNLNNLNITMSDYFHQTVDFDPGPGVANLTANGSNQDAFMAQYSQQISQLPAPSNTTPPPNLVICPGQTTQLMAISNLCAGGHLSWYSASSGGIFLGGNDTLLTAPINTTTTFYVEDSICGGISARTAITVSVTGTSNLTVNSPSLCAGQSATLTASGSTSYTWSTGATTGTIVVSPSTSTSYTVSGGSGTCSSTLVSMVTVATTPTISITGDSICAGQRLVLVASGANTYTWSTGATSSSISVSPAASSSFSVLGANNTNGSCAGTAVYSVTVFPSPVATISGNVTIGAGNTATLTAGGGGAYQWFPGSALSCASCENVSVSPSTTTEYCVEVSNSNGCKDTACAWVYVEYECIVNASRSAPNAFSPNGDHINDEFVLEGWKHCVKEFNIQIYDRWGEKIFESDQVDFAWDGTYKGKVLDMAVFVYQIRATMVDNTKIMHKGNISLLR